MAKTTISFGVVLILLGIFAFVGSRTHAPTALIPAFVGLLLGIFGFLAITDDAKKRMLFMHIAVTLGTAWLSRYGEEHLRLHSVASGQCSFLIRLAVKEKAAMAVLLLIFVVLCVRSFVAARRARA